MKLRPCPFCGKRAIHDATIGQLWVRCIDQDACGGCVEMWVEPSMTRAKNRKVVSERWNQRHPKSTKAKQ